MSETETTVSVEHSAPEPSAPPAIPLTIVAPDQTETIRLAETVGALSETVTRLSTQVETLTSRLETTDQAMSRIDLSIQEALAEPDEPEVTMVAPLPPPPSVDADAQKAPKTPPSAFHRFFLGMK